MESVAESVVTSVLASMSGGIKTPLGVSFSYQVAEDQGPRPQMEDKFLIEPYANELFGSEGERISLFSVYDGHGGPLTAEYVAKHLHVALIRDEYFKREVTGSLRESFLSTNEYFFQHIERENLGINVGSTAVLTMIRGNKLWVAWAGDSEAALYRSNGEAIPLCITHKPWMPKEKERIEMMGGTVEERGGLFRVCGALAVARAFGDAKYRQFITSEPDILSLDLVGNEEFLVVACDGLWDVMTHAAVGTFLQQHRGTSMQGMAEALVHHARSLGSTDNITCVIVIFG